MLGNAGRKLCAGLADIQWPLVSPVVCSRPLASPVTARRPTLVRQLASLHQRLGCRAWSSSLSATLLRDRPQNCCSDIWSPCARGSHTPLSRCFSSRRQYGLTRDRKAIAAHAVHAIHAQRRGIIWLVRGSQQWPKRSRAPEKFALGAYGGGRRWRSRQAKMKSDNAREGKGNNSHSTPGDPSPNQTHLLQRLPHMPHIHRPTREELLAAATGFWARLKVRFKWFSIRSLRPFNTDDISAFFSWVLVGHLIWILVGTTTFFSIVVFTVNTVFAQETLTRWVGNYLTRSSGIKVVFESAIVPRWRDGVITLRNVFVSRRPGQGSSEVSKGSSTTAAAAAAARRKDGDDTRERPAVVEELEEDTNYTQFDLTIDTVNVTLSFAKWFNGKGLLRDVEVKGIRGIVDRRSVHPTGENVDPRSFKHEHHPGDFEMDSFRLQDLLVTVYQPNGFRAFPVSIFSCDLPRLRKQWLFYDILSANNMSGSFDNSLFTILPRQVHGNSGVDFDDVVGSGRRGGDSEWMKHSRLRLDGLSIDHLNRGVQGPFSWIHEGNVDVVADIMLPNDSNDGIAKVMSDVYDRVEATVTSTRRLSSSLEQPAPTRSSEGEADALAGDGEQPAEPSPHSGSHSDDDRYIVMDLRVHLTNVRAAVPLFTKELSYVNNAMIRPIVAYINSKNAFIPIHCRIVKRASDFDGSWTIFDSGLMEDLSAESYQAFTRDILDEQSRRRRLRKVGLWSLQVAIQALFMGLATNVAII